MFPNRKNEYFMRFMNKNVKNFIMRDKPISNLSLIFRKIAAFIFEITAWLNCLAFYDLQNVQVIFTTH